MNWKRAILTLQISILLLAFGAVTFHFQYAARKDSHVACADCKKDANEFPSSEKETADSDSDGEEEEQDEDRAFHPSMIDTEAIDVASLSFRHLVTLDFKEIHFEIITPPPQLS